MEKATIQINEVMKSFAEFFNEIHDDNDRAAVIVGAANIDSVLEKLLIQSLLPSIKRNQSRDNDELFGIGMPLSSFSSKITLSYRMGIIDKDFYSSLNIIRKIRNEFAHKIKGCDLNSKSNTNKIQELKQRFNDNTVNMMQTYYPGSTDSSKIFRVIVSLISSLLEMKLLNMPKTKKLNPVSASWIPSVKEPEIG